MLNKDILPNILNEYEKNVLQIELGKGNLKTRLMNNLEKSVLKKISKDSKQGNHLVSLENPIDYNFINKQPIKERIKNCLNARKIKTYADLIEYCYEFYFKNDRQQEWKDKITYEKNLNRIHNMGEKSVGILIRHLKSINFDFSEEYAKKVVEKSKSSA